MTTRQRCSRRGLAGHVGMLAAAAIAFGMCIQPAAAERITKVAILGGQQEVPAVPTPASGFARFVIDTTAKTLSYHIVFSGLVAAETGAHIHGAADPGLNAGVVHILPAGNPKIGSWAYPAASEADILAGKTYVNIHSAVFGGGEIRGQIVDMVALINGAQEAPPVATPAAGFGLFNMDRCANRLDYYINYGGLVAAETGAHIHGFAMHGVNAGVQVALPAGPTKIGSWIYDEAEELRILDGQTYVNIHSVANPGGEIRGQITPFVVPLDGSQEVPPTGAIGHGCGMIAVSPGAATLSYYLESANLTGVVTGQHIHGFAPPGANAGVQQAIVVANPVIGSWAYGAVNEPNVFAGLSYFNVHTVVNPGGEIRGRIEPPLKRCFADITCDGMVDVADLLDLLAAWGACPAAPTPCPEDTNHDAVVDVADLLDILGIWGPCP